MSDEAKVISALFMDRSEPLGNSPDAQGRRRLHTLVTNDTSHPIFQQLVPLNLLRVTLIQVGDSAWVKLPTTPLANRVSLIIQNSHPKQNLYINYTDTGPLREGFIVYPEGVRELVLGPNVEVYGVMEQNYSASIIIEEGST